MLDFAGNRLSSSHPAPVSIIGGALRTPYNKNVIRDHEFCFQAKVELEANYSPTLWNNNSYDQFSSLLPCDHQYSNLSQPRLPPLQAIVEARKELMEMIKDMPESNYELSFKDLVEDQDSKEGDNKVCFETEAQIKKINKRKMMMKRMESMGSYKFTRSASMDSEIFLIKIFSIPSCFGGSKKKNNGIIHKNGSSKVSPRNSFEVPEDDDDHHKEPMIIRRIFSAGGSKSWCKIFSNSSSSSNSDGVSTSSRLGGKYFSPCCWSFWQIKKSKARKQRLM